MTVGPSELEGPDDVAARFGDAAETTSITIRTLDDEYVEIEAPEIGLRFLGELLIAQANAHDCGFQLSPRGAGSSFFAATVGRGLDIHRLPCIHEPPGSHGKSPRKEPE